VADGRGERHTLSEFLVYHLSQVAGTVLRSSREVLGQTIDEHELIKWIDGVFETYLPLNQAMIWDWEIDGWIVLAGVLASMSSAVLGCLLLLRRLSLLGDAISHSVLPGIAAAFLFTGQRGTLVVFLGAAVTGLLTVWLSETIRRYGRVEESAAIGIVFTSMFALGLVLILRGGDHVDLDPSCILYGNLETSILDNATTPFGQIPRVVITLSCVLLINLFCLTIFFKEWQVTTFDAAFAESQGIPSRCFHYLLAALVAITCIASFEAVGNILVVAVLIVPAAVGFLLSTRLSWMFGISMLIAACVAILGHLAAIGLPPLFGLRSVNSAAMMAVIAGAFVIGTVLFGFRSGILSQYFRQRAIANQILQDDVLALLYRQKEKRRLGDRKNQDDLMSLDEIASRLRCSVARIRDAVSRLMASECCELRGGSLQLTETGRKQAQNLVRSHRLWEQYLSVEANLPETKVHPHAETWEHFTSPSMRGELDSVTGKLGKDPHGREIPPEG
jgi:manganese/zinc/iron transport system permease protein